MLGSLVPDKQQLLMIIAIYLNNEAAGALYFQTKGQKSAVKCYLFSFVFADIINDCIYDTYSTKKKAITPCIIFLIISIINNNSMLRVPRANS